MAEKLKVGDKAPVGTAVTVDDETITLDESLWAEGPTLLTFLRHFG